MMEYPRKFQEVGHMFCALAVSISQQIYVDVDRMCSEAQQRGIHKFRVGFSHATSGCDHSQDVGIAFQARQNL